MSAKKSDVADLIRRLSEAKVINTDVSLKATLGVVSGASSSDEIDPLDFWCGTVRRPWVVIRPHVDVDQSIIEITRSLANVSQQAAKQAAKQAVARQTG
jgi:hypothetical protein